MTLTNTTAALNIKTEDARLHARLKTDQHNMQDATAALNSKTQDYTQDTRLHARRNTTINEQ